MNKLPKVSIVLPVYNGGKYLRQSIDSCLRQSYKNIELIIVDDCSTDDTPVVAKSYVDPCVLYIRNKTNQRLPKSLNIGFEKATGDYLTWTSDDNLYASESIARMLDLLVGQKENFVYCNYYTFCDDDLGQKKLVELPSPPVFHKINPIRACFLYSRKVKEEVGEYDPDVELVEDYDYWIRVSKKFTMHHIKEPLYFYRVHEASLYSSRYWQVEVVKYLLRLKYEIADIDTVTSDITRIMAEKRRRFVKFNRTLTRILFQRRIRTWLKNYKKGKISFNDIKNMLNDLMQNDNVRFKTIRCTL